MTDDDKLLQIQRRYWEAQQELVRRMNAGGKQAAVISPEPSDRRFKAPEWAEQPFFDYLRQSYLLYSRYVMELADASTLQGQAREKHLFFTRRYLEAISPANFAATNPEVLKLAAATGGETLARGLRNLFADVGKGRIALADEAAFEVGKNLATTPGAVVFENDVMQFIQYAPLTKKVYERARCCSSRRASASTTCSILSRRTRSSATAWARATPCSWSRGATRRRSWAA